MALNHLSDDEIQGHLDGNTTRGESVKDHLRSCPRCAELVENYRELFLSLADDRGFDLPEGFAANVAARVVTSAKTNSRSWILDAVLIGGAMAACLITALIFIDFSTWLVELKHTLAMDSLLAHLGIKSNLLASAAAAMLAIGLADRLITVIRRSTTPFTI